MPHYDVTDYDNESERAYKERYNEQYDDRAKNWEHEYFDDYDDYEY